MLRVLDLFSGIGGFSLGLERTGGFETAAFCEIEKYPVSQLKKNFPGVPVYDDIKTLTAEQLVRDGIGRIDVITGGYPCQPFSVDSIWIQASREAGAVHQAPSVNQLFNANDQIRRAISAFLTRTCYWRSWMHNTMTSLKKQ